MLWRSAQAHILTFQNYFYGNRIHPQDQPKKIAHSKRFIKPSLTLHPLDSFLLHFDFNWIWWICEEKHFRWENIKRAHYEIKSYRECNDLLSTNSIPQILSLVKGLSRPEHFLPLSGLDLRPLPLHVEVALAFLSHLDVVFPDHDRRHPHLHHSAVLSLRPMGGSWRASKSEDHRGSNSPSVPTAARFQRREIRPTRRGRRVWRAWHRSCRDSGDFEHPRKPWEVTSSTFPMKGWDLRNNVKTGSIGKERSYFVRNV